MLCCIVFHLQARQNEIYIGGAGERCKRREEKMEVLGLAPENFS